MYLTICSLDGGVGKTTLAIHLSAVLAENKKQVLLIDSDLRNRTASRWGGDLADLPFDVVDQRQVARKSEGRVYQHVIYDTQGGADQQDWNILAEGCDLFLLPAVPVRSSLDSLARTVDFLRKAPDANFRAVLSKVPPAVDGVPSGEETIARGFLKQEGIPVCKTAITHRKALIWANQNGCLVRDLKAYKAAEAWAQYVALAREATYAAKQ